jgi:hypothetical protein
MCLVFGLLSNEVLYLLLIAEEGAKAQTKEQLDPGAYHKTIMSKSKAQTRL